MENEELHKIAPKLSKIKKENNYSVPDGYFDSISSRLQDRLHPEKKPSLLEKAMVFVKPHLALAGMMVGIMVIALIAVNYLSPDKMGGSTSYPVELADALEFELNEMDEITLMQMLAEEQPEEETFVTGEDEQYIDQAIEYLLNEGVSMETLVQELEMQN